MRWLLRVGPWVIVAGQTKKNHLPGIREAPCSISFVERSSRWRFSPPARSRPTRSVRSWAKARVDNAVFTAESSRRSLVPEVPAKEALAAEAGLRDMYKNVLYIKRTKPLASAAELRSQAAKPLDSAVAYINRGYDMTRRNLYVEAIADFDSAIKLEPGNVLAWANKGVSLLELKRFDEARVALRKAQELDPQSAMALRGLGALAQDEGRLPEAIELLGKSLALEDNAWARNRRIDANLKAGNVAQAAQDLVFLSRADPTRRSHFENRAFELMREQRGADVRVLAKAALDNQAGPAKGVVIAASLYQIANAPEDARSLINEHIRKAPTPELYMALLNLGGTTAQMDALFEQALALDPKYTPALEQLAAFQLATRKYAEVLQTMDRLDALEAPTAMRLVTRAEAQAQLGDKQRAQQSYAAARGLTRSGGEFNDLCWSQARSNLQLEDALRDCESSLALLPNCAACLDSHAMVLLRMGRYEEAVKAYDKAVAARPRAANSLYGRGLAKLGAGRKDEGEADLTAARGMDPFIEPRFRDSTGIQR